MSEAKPESSYFLRLWGKSRGNGGGETIPPFGFLAQTLPASGGEFVELGAAIILGGAPTRLQQPLAYQAKQTRIERALLDQQGVAGDLPNAQQNAISVQGAERDRPQNQKIEGPGK